MLLQLDCPCCQKPLFFPHKEEYEQDLLFVLCATCNYKYALHYSEVLKFASNAEQLPGRKTRKPIKYKQVYELQVVTPSGVIKSLEFSTLGQDEKLQAQPGDELLLLYTMRGAQVSDLLLVTNCTTGKKHQLFSPSSKARIAGIKAAGITCLVVLLLIGLLHGPDHKAMLVTTIPSALGVGVYVTQRQSPRERDRLIASRLGAEQKLLQQQFGLEQRVEQLRQEEATHTRLLKRLSGLYKKMLRAGDLYVERAAQVKSAISILQKQIKLIQSLMDGYIKVIELIEIEFETSQLAEQLPVDIDVTILSQLDELKGIEQQKEELGLRVDANRLLSMYQ